MTNLNLNNDRGPLEKTDASMKDYDYLKEDPADIYLRKDTV